MNRTVFLKLMIFIPGHNHAYLPALGYPETNAAALSLLLGADSSAIAEGRAFAAQVRTRICLFGNRIRIKGTK